LKKVMGAFFLFIVILILIILFLALGFVGSIVGGILKFFGINVGKRKTASGRNRYEEDLKQVYRSEEGTRRMRKFKNTAEDAEYEDT